MIDPTTAGFREAEVGTGALAQASACRALARLVGDAEPYAARLDSTITDCLGLDRRKANVQEKLETLDDVYRFAVEQSGMSRGHVMELTVVLILVVELVMAFVGR